MNNSLQIIPFSHLMLAFIPALAAVAILYKWSLNYKNALYAISRMLGQLLIIGYFLTYIFKSENPWVVVAVLSVMVFASSWIALRTITVQSRRLYILAFISMLIGGGSTLLLISQFVLALKPWFYPRYMIPIAGMIFANSLNSVSLAAERLAAEMGRDVDFMKARGIALRASLIPITNSLFAVGLVSLPGMMTGQILSGVPPLIAVRYQIMVMCMIFGSAGISAACFLSFIKPYVSSIQQKD